MKKRLTVPPGHASFQVFDHELLPSVSNLEKSTNRLTCCRPQAKSVSHLLLHLRLFPPLETAACFFPGHRRDTERLRRIVGRILGGIQARALSLEMTKSPVPGPVQAVSLQTTKGDRVTGLGTGDLCLLIRIMRNVPYCYFYGAISVENGLTQAAKSSDYFYLFKLGWAL